MDDTGGLVYVVDDDASVREGLAALVASAGLIAKTAASTEEFLDMVRPDVPSCLVLDVEPPGRSGIELERELIRRGIQIPIIFLAGDGSIPMTVQAVKAGAADFFTKPFDDEELLSAIQQCIAQYDATHRQGRSQLKELTQGELDFDEKLRGEKGFEIIGISPTLMYVFELVKSVAQTDSTVLLLGETGTGKELIARTLHVNSRRKDSNFVRLNCAAIPTGLLESDLFGHERGAFTGAFMQKVGRLELADQGTLFLDEVGDIPLEIQPKLLRALQEREFERLGSTRTRKANVRVIAATNRDLQTMVARGEFRSDLYYRLNVFPIRIPPLRERREDIPLLVRHFVLKHSRRMQKRIDVVSKTTLEKLVGWKWPGNVRELENFIERAVILSRGGSLDAPLNELREAILAAASTSPEKSVGHEDVVRIVRETIERLNITRPKSWPQRVAVENQRREVMRVLRETHGQVGGADGAAARMGIKRTTLISRMKKLGIHSDKLYRSLESSVWADRTEEYA
jgi:DNA-binding NtrC family response regulator